MKFFTLIIPLIFLLSFLFAVFKKVRVYDSFTEGVKGALPLVMSIFPYIAAVMMLTKLFEVSGLENKTCSTCSRPSSADSVSPKKSHGSSS